MGSVHGVGLIMRVEFVADKARKRFFDPKVNAHRIVAKKALEHGILTRALLFVEVNAFSPPLCITKAEVDEAIESYSNALGAATSELRRRAE
jgi:L-2,4-diaminobutyrate transaminase